MMNSLFLEIAAVMMTAGLFSLIAYRLHQPLIIAYIATGIVVGPGMFDLAQSLDVFETMSSIGIAFLLFIVGLNLNWRSVKDVGRVAMIAGFAQVVVTSVIGTSIALWMNIPMGTSLFLGVAFSFSSTIIIVKLLTDKEDLDRLYGRIAVGMLIVQDLIAMIILLVLAALQDGGDVRTILSVSLGKGIVAIFVLWVLAKLVVPKIFSYAARSQELLFLIALGWCFMIASALQYFGFGIEIGALLAGVSLAGTGFQHEIEAKIRSLRDFFLVIFFIVLGTHLTLGSVGDLLLPAIALSLYVLIGNPLIAQIIMRV
ncbi:MAG: cation:proton antiporter, partial [Patescibacteria group bacterium]